MARANILDLRTVADKCITENLISLGTCGEVNTDITPFKGVIAERVEIGVVDKDTLLDEPTTGLDPLVRRDFYQIISDLRAGGTTVVISVWNS